MGKIFVSFCWATFLVEKPVQGQQTGNKRAFFNPLSWGMKTEFSITELMVNDPRSMLHRSRDDEISVFTDMD